MDKNYEKYTKVAIGGLVLINIIIYYAIFNYIYFKPKVLFLPVGEGDSELIKTKAGNILIDAGPKQNVLVPLSQKTSLFDKTIDIALITHPDVDHFEGLLKILDYYKVRLVVLNNFSSQNGTYIELLLRLCKQEIPIVVGTTDTIIYLGQSDTFLKILYPDIQNLQNIKADNDFSIISLLNLNNKKFLFTGDITAKLLDGVVDKFLKGQTIDVLKVPHHGAKNTLSDNILNNILVKQAIIEVGKNSYGHPTDFIINLLRDFGISYKRTDLDGIIEFQ